MNLSLFYAHTTQTTSLNFSLSLVFLWAGYKCLHFPSGRMSIKRHVVFYSDSFPFETFSDTTAAAPVGLLPLPIGLPPVLSQPALNPPPSSPPQLPQQTEPTEDPTLSSPTPNFETPAHPAIDLVVFLLSLYHLLHPNPSLGAKEDLRTPPILWLLD